MLIIFNGGFAGMVLVGGGGGPADVSRHENKLECVLNNAARDSREEEERDLLAILDKMGVQ